MHLFCFDLLEKSWNYDSTDDVDHIYGNLVENGCFLVENISPKKMAN